MLGTNEATLKSALHSHPHCGQHEGPPNGQQSPLSRPVAHNNNNNNNPSWVSHSNIAMDPRTQPEGQAPGSGKHPDHRHFSWTAEPPKGCQRCMRLGSKGGPTPAWPVQVFLHPTGSEPSTPGSPGSSAHTSQQQGGRTPQRTCTCTA